METRALLFCLEMMERIRRKVDSHGLDSVTTSFADRNEAIHPIFGEMEEERTEPFIRFRTFRVVETPIEHNSSFRRRFEDQT